MGSLWKKDTPGLRGQTKFHVRFRMLHCPCTCALVAGHHLAVEDFALLIDLLVFK
jgi:hypothetical protein